MRFYKRFSVFLAGFTFACLAWAASNAIVVKHADLMPVEDYLALNADFEISFGTPIEEAIKKGVPLSFLVEFQLVEPRKYWFDDEIVTIRKSINLSYHALTRQYLVSDEAHQKSFETLNEARQQLMALRNWQVIQRDVLEDEIAYQAALLMRLDKTKLPKAIQVDTISAEHWNISSTIYTWSIKDIK
jgi:hypothetical protein